MITLDCETCGLHGVPVLIQWAEDEGEIHLHNPWRVPVKDTLALIEKICESNVLGFNLAFDWFHMNKLYNIFRLVYDKSIEPDIDECGWLEPDARDGVCLKPRSALDLFLHAKKGPYQTLMEREDVRIKRVPTALATPLALELEKRIQIPDIYFARRSDKYAPKWKVLPDDEDADFADVKLTFASSSALKSLCIDAFHLDPKEVLFFADVDVKGGAVNEEGWAPFARALAPRAPRDWNNTWPEKLPFHITHWQYNDLARTYATKDITLTRQLYHYFKEPAFGDVDSILACCVAACRWRGFSVDLDKVRELKSKSLGKMAGYPTAPGPVRIYLEEVMSEDERIVLTDTKKTTLEAIAQWRDVKDGASFVHPVAERAQKVLNARSAQKEVELFDKLLVAGRFHASFKVIGTLSGRMSGADGLNPQGINRHDDIRSCFTLCWKDEILTGGDFSGLEVTIAEAAYCDPLLRQDLLSGKKIHALFGQCLFPDFSYDDIVASQGQEDDKYDKSKRSVFAVLYGGTGDTIVSRIGVSKEQADGGYELFMRKYTQVGVARKKVFDAFCSMRQNGGIGTKVEWHEPSESIESLFGFKRYYTLENKICRALFDLAEAPPKEWCNLKVKVRRRDREQTAAGATRSAIFAAAFAIQAMNMRSAANHVIQSSGATLTKELQAEIWSLQPQGIHEWVVMTLNIHDEVNAPCKPELLPDILQIQAAFVEKHKNKIPLLKMSWQETMKDWSGKH